MPAPLGIGTVRLADGTSVKCFLCEAGGDRRRRRHHPLRRLACLHRRARGRLIGSRTAAAISPSLLVGEGCFSLRATSEPRKAGRGVWATRLPSVPQPTSSMIDTWAAATRQPSAVLHPCLHLPADLARRAVAPEEGRGDGEIAAVGGHHRLLQLARQSGRRARRAERGDLVVAVEVLGDAIADGRRRIEEQPVERGDVVARPAPSRIRRRPPRPPPSRLRCRSREPYRSSRDLSSLRKGMFSYWSGWTRSQSTPAGCENGVRVSISSVSVAM